MSNNRKNRSLRKRKAKDDQPDPLLHYLQNRMEITKEITTFMPQSLHDVLMNYKQSLSAK